MDQQVAREKTETSSLGGDVDSVIREVEKLFTELPRLLAQAYGRWVAAEVACNRRIKT